MKYLVIIQPRAESDIDQAAEWIAQDSPVNAARWYHGLVQAVFSLREFPLRCSLAPEDESTSGRIRQLLYGSYRILFTVKDDVVHVLHVRHGARGPAGPEDLLNPPGS